MMKARDILPVLQAHPDVDIMVLPQDYDVLGNIESVEYQKYSDGTEAIEVKIS